MAKVVLGRADIRAPSPIVPRKSGRPSFEDAQRLDEHILDIAERKFLSVGFAKTSIDTLAVAARASKKTIYHRYSGKDALFKAVVERAIGRAVEASRDVECVGSTVEDRLERLAVHILEGSLQPELIELVRIVIPEAHRFAALAQMLNTSGFKAMAHSVAGFLEMEVSAGTFDLNEAAEIAGAHFLSLILGSRLLQALMGQDAGVMRAEALAMVRSAVSIFLKGAVRSRRSMT